MTHSTRITDAIAVMPAANPMNASMHFATTEKSVLTKLLNVLALLSGTGATGGTALLIPV